MDRALAALAVAAVVLAVALSGPGERTRATCTSLGAYDFDTYEAFDNAGVYNTAIELAAAGLAVTSATTPAGEAHHLEYPGLLSGNRAAREGQTQDTSLRIPPSLMKAVVWVESQFQQASDKPPYGGVGDTKTSYDCGYGLGQITSGMENRTGNPTARQALTGTHFLFNLAHSASILAEKWNYYRFWPTAGNGDPAVLEDWYYALWAYNGIAATNHPLLNRDPLRGDVWHCRDEGAPTWVDAGDGTPLYGYSDYTYPERIYGCMRHPPPYPERILHLAPPLPTPTPTPAPTPTPTPAPTPSETPAGESTATATATATPTPTATATPTATPTPTPTPTATVAATPATTPDAVRRMWPAVAVNMPDLSIPAVMKAFSLTFFIACENALQNFNLVDGCPGMTFPTSFPELGIESHRDPTPPVDAGARERLLGRPVFAARGPSVANLAVDGDGNAESVDVTVWNTGTWIAPFRITRTANWIVVRRGEENAPFTGHFHGGVAIGAETKVVIFDATRHGTEVSEQGRAPVLRITLNTDALPEGEDVEGAVLIEPLHGEGRARRVLVRAGPGVNAGLYPDPTETPEPETPTPTPGPGPGDAEAMEEPDGAGTRRNIAMPALSSDR